MNQERGTLDPENQPNAKDVLNIRRNAPITNSSDNGKQSTDDHQPLPGFEVAGFGMERTETDEPGYDLTCTGNPLNRRWFFKMV